MIENISQAGTVLIGVQTFVFSAIIILGIYQKYATKNLRVKLEKSLITSSDHINSQQGMERLAADCRTRYANAAEKIESVDVDAIVQSEIARFPLIKIQGIKWTFEQVDELLQGGPGFLITLGLIGTFWGLIQNLSGLSSLLLIGEGITSQRGLIEGFAELFPAMGAAFATSLLGIFLSSIIWILSVLLGIARVKPELEHLLSGYLEQVVQANCRCYSLVGESMERMEQYLTEYLSKFSEYVGKSIEYSINKSIGKLMDTLNEQVKEMSNFVYSISEGSKKLGEAGDTFADATEKLRASSFASEFGNACEGFINHTKLLMTASEHLGETSERLNQETQELSKYISELKESQFEHNRQLSESANAVSQVSKQAGSALNNSMQELSEAVEVINGLQKRGMTWLSMRAKTDSKLTELNDNLIKLVLNLSITTEKINASSQENSEYYSRELRRLSQQSNALLEAIKNNENQVQDVKTGLTQMGELERRLRELES